MPRAEDRKEGRSRTVPPEKKRGPGCGGAKKVVLDAVAKEGGAHSLCFIRIVGQWGDGSNGDRGKKKLTISSAPCSPKTGRGERKGGESRFG